MSPLTRWWIRRSMEAMLGVSAWLARRNERASLAWMRWLARAQVRRKRIGVAADPAALGAAWQRGFPSARQVPIRAIDGTTVLADIETPCPLRGSGDTLACWRMMAYDREIALAAGGQFVVLRSQAEPGVAVCRVALRPMGADVSDLVPAHLRAPTPRSFS
jgi:hypothetical protein